MSFKKFNLRERMAIYFLAGSMLFAGAEGCKGDCPRKPLTSAPSGPTNPHPDLFSDVYDDFPELIEGDFVFDYGWDADHKGDMSGVAQMDTISAELKKKRTSAHKTGTDELFLRVEDDDIGKSDHDGNGIRDYVGRIHSRNKLGLTDFPKFDDFDKKIMTYDDAVQNAVFYTKKNGVDILDYEVYGVGNTGLYCGLPGIVKARADIIIRYKNNSVDILRFDTFSTPIDIVPGGDLDMFDQYFDTHANGKFKNTQVFIFSDYHTQDAKDKLRARELNRIVMNRSLYRK